MKIDVLDTKGKKIEQLDLADEVFKIIPNNTAISHYVRVYLANQCQGTSSTKTRGDVSGGGKKPWAQKGTGNARAGSTRSPVWRHGGVAHGPKPRSWKLSLSQAIKALALKSALSFKFSNDSVLVVDSFAITSPKTKAVTQVLNDLNVTGKSLIITKDYDKTLLMSATNLPKVKMSFIGTLNAYEVLNAPKIIFTKDAVLGFEEKYK